MIPIPIGTDYTATVTGSMLKLVPCEHCQAPYGYELRRTASAQETSWLFLNNEGAQRAASASAAAALMQALSVGCEVVPCPECGWVQEHMHRKARKQHLRWLWYAGVGAFIAACVWVPVMMVAMMGARHSEPAWPLTVWLTLIAAAPVLIITRKVLAARFDPNSEDVEARLTRGRALALRQDQLAALAAEMARHQQEEAKIREDEIRRQARGG